MDEAQKPSIVWKISSASNGTNCVEVGFCANSVLVRDSKNRDAGSLPVRPQAWKEFISAIRSGQHILQ